jgi:glycosyltransferase involved in cell wall biosynthesis
MTHPTRRHKVLLLITKSNWGGAQRYVYDLTTQLDHKVFDVVVVLGGTGTLVEQLTHAGIRTITLPSLHNQLSAHSLWRSGIELYHILRSERPDILHVNSSVAGLVGTVTGRLARVPRIIFTAHGWAFNEDRSWWQKLVIKFFHWLTVLLTHKTIAVSRAIIAQMNWPGAPAKMKLIHPGRTIGVMYGRSEARREITQITPRLTPYREDTWIGCVAELHPIKRHEVLLTSILSLQSTHPTLRLVIIGEGVMRQSLEDFIATHRLEEHVFLTGAITEAARFLSVFDLFVLASASESYGYVLHEAGLAGVPMIATNVGGIKDIITHEETGLLVPANDSGSLADAIHTLLTNRTLASTYAQQAHHTLTKRSVATMTEAISSLYLLRL